MLDITCKQQFMEAFNFALSNDCLCEFIEALRSLDPQDSAHVRCVVRADLAPLSFEFRIVGRHRAVVRAGRLVYSGPGGRAAEQTTRPSGQSAAAQHAWTVVG